MGFYTKATLKTEIRALLKEPTELFFLDTEIEGWIDQAAVDISMKTLCYESIDTVTLVSGTIEYSVPTDTIKIYGCSNSNDGMIKIHPRNLAHITEVTSGAPKYYYHFADKLGFYPIASATGSVSVYSSKITNDITDIPDEYQPYAISFGMWKAKLKDDKFSQANAYLVQYLNSLIFHRQDLYERGVDSKDMAKVPDRTVIAEK